MTWLLDGVDSLSSKDVFAISALATHFGGLALAIKQAATFMNRMQYSPSRFAKLYEEKASEIDDFRVPGYEWCPHLCFFIHSLAMILTSRSRDVSRHLGPDLSHTRGNLWFLLNPEGLLHTHIALCRCLSVSTFANWSLRREQMCFPYLYRFEVPQSPLPLSYNPHLRRANC